MTAPTPVGLDTGLLSPVRAGTPVEAAVGDEAWLRAMLDAEATLARVQAELGTLPESAAVAIGKAARTHQFDLRALAVASRETANPVVGLVAALTGVVAAVDPGAAEYVHQGSTSQDILDTAAMLVAARALDLLLADLRQIAAALAGLAAEHRDTPMAGRTLALHAVPTTFGLKAAGWRALVLDAADRVARTRRDLPMSLGGAAGTLAGYLECARLARSTAPRADSTADDGTADDGAYLDRLVDAFARETGLARPVLPWHALRTPIAELAATLAFCSAALGKLAVDVQSGARTEVAELAEPGQAGRGSSSAMPHKRNPVLATLIRSAALQVPAMAGALTACLTTEDERSAGVWHAEWLLLRECLRLTGGAAHTAVELVDGLQVDPEQMRRNLAITGSQVVAERISAVLAPVLGRGPAKALLTRAADITHHTGRPLADVLADIPEVARALDTRQLAELCDPTAYTGGAGPLVDRALADRAPIA